MDMADDLLYRYTSAGKGIFMQEDDLTPPELRPKVEKAKEWLPAPHLDCECRFWMTEKGRAMYESILKPLHAQYMPPIEREQMPRSDLGEVVYEDEFQVGEKV